MNHKIETVTPDLARKFLTTMDGDTRRQRPINRTVVERYAADMRAGHWLVNHQGLAFDEHGRMVDGQHRCASSILANVNFTTLVTRGIPEKAENGLCVFTQDTFDIGRKRTVGDALEFAGTRHGRTIASMAVVVAVAAGYTRQSLSVPQVRVVIQQYGEQIDFVVNNYPKIPVVRSSPVVGAMAFALKACPEPMKEFYQRLTTLESLSAKDRTAPIYHLYHDIGQPSALKLSSRLTIIRRVLNAAQAWVEGGNYEPGDNTKHGQEFFKLPQASAVNHVLSEITCE